MSQLTAEQLEIINQPLVQSLLYDINLLPEQLTTMKEGPGHRHWFYMLAVLEHFDMAFKERDELIDVLQAIVDLDAGDKHYEFDAARAVLAKHAKEKA